MDWELYSFIISSIYRKKILHTLMERPKTPTEIRNETDYYLSHVSNVLNELLKKDLIVCLTPSRSKGRVYRLTEQGIEIILYIDKHKI